MTQSERATQPLEQRVAEFWEANPCDAAPHQLKHPAYRGVRWGTAEFYHLLDELRYCEYPFFWSTFEFESHAGECVLDVGCGLGIDLRQFAKHGANVIGLDITDTAVRNTLRSLRVFDLRGTVVKGDAGNLPFEAHSFDLVYSNGVLHHLPDTERAVSEMHRILKPGGKAIVLLYHRQSLRFYWGILVIQGLVKLRLFRYRLSVTRLVSNSTDGAGNPISKLYSRATAKQLFSQFTSASIEVHHVSLATLLPKLGSRIPRRSLPSWMAGLLDRLGERVGWFLIVKAIK